MLASILSGSRIDARMSGNSYDLILQAIRSGKITNADIARHAGIPLEKTGMLLRQMRDDGLLVSLTRGKWMERVGKWKSM